jgi:hypothetical protein
MKKLVLLTLALAIVLGSTAAGGKPVRLRQFYLTVTTHDGASALTACAPGYHMASMWEILDPSNLLYDTELGDTQDDAGQGPPNDFDGWVRTGNNASGGGSAGSANCEAWTSFSNDDIGTAAELVQSGWSQGSRLFFPVAPWAAFTRNCDTPNNVWCVEDVRVRSLQEDADD